MLNLQSADTLQSKNQFTLECLTHAHAIDDIKPVIAIKLLQEKTLFCEVVALLL